MRKCKHCQSEIANKAKVCPQCGKRQGMPIWLIVIIVIACIVVIDSIAGGGSSSDDSKDNRKVGTTEKKKELTVEEGHTGALDDYGYSYYIEGYVKNNSEKEYSYVQIDFTTYDSNGNTLGTCLDNNSGLEPDGRWKFKAICTSDVENIASYKLKEITGY